MRILFFVILSIFILNSKSSAEIIDCTQFTKFTDKLNCKANNLKATLNKKQADTKEKISDAAKSLKSKVTK
tara:strand:- start:2595 stop:2807 length:213 start_codon:yes stop_codon:yes gene_type:complete